MNFSDSLSALNRRALPARRARLRSGRSGSVMMEFALIAFVLYIFLASTIEMGRMLFSAQAVQAAARLCAREMALVPLPAEFDFDTALESGLVKERVFDKDLLAIDFDYFPDDESRQRFLDTLPPVNQALLPVMVFDSVRFEGSTRRFLRYPGALLRNPDIPFGHPSGGFTVGIPEVVSRDEDGVETIRWLPPVEEVRADPYDPSTGRFSLVSDSLRSGMVLLRFNYPYQAATLTAFRQEPSLDTVEGHRNIALQARDQQVVQLNDPTYGEVIPITGSGPYAGAYGLGRHYALLESVRPFRKLISVQAGFRREIFQ